MLVNVLAAGLSWSTSLWPAPAHLVSFPLGTPGGALGHSVWPLDREALAPSWEHRGSDGGKCEYQSKSWPQLISVLSHPSVVF